MKANNTGEKISGGDTVETLLPGSLVETIRDALFAVDASWCLTYLNQQAESLLGCPRAELLGRRLTPSLAEWFTPDLLTHLAHAHATRTPHATEHFHAPAARWYETHAHPTPHGLTVLARDITPRKEAQLTRDRLLTVLEATPDLVALSDQHGNLVYLNAAGRQLLQLQPHHTHGDTIPSHAAHHPVFEQLFPIGVDHGVWYTETLLHTRHGNPLPVSQVVIPHHTPDGRIAYLSTIARDLTERKRLDAQLQHQMRLLQDYSAQLEQQQHDLQRALAELQDANTRLELLAATDALTNLPNRRAFDTRLTDEVRRAHRYNLPLSLLLLDIDRFKTFNDTFGHPEGDHLLQRFAAILRQQARATDFPARYGGEEFAVILPETEPHAALDAAERLRHALATQHHNHPVTASLGAATLTPQHTPQQLLDAADTALYHAKNTGRNRSAHADNLPKLPPKP